MKQYRYTLQPYTGRSSRYPCPSCGKKYQFARYIDTETGELLDEKYGRCNREDKCGYHLRPSMQGDILTAKPVKQMRKNSDYIAGKVWRASLKAYEKNPLFIWLANAFTPQVAAKALATYNVGTSNKWQGACVFWQVDDKGICRSGKVVGYDPATGKRIKEPYTQTTWAHTALGLDDFNLEQCLFGLHLLPNTDKKRIFIFESEKTAIIASLFFHDALCLACGGKQMINKSMLWPLRKHKVVLYPDYGCFEDWSMKAHELPYDNIEVSPVLENAKGLKDGDDMADLLTHTRDDLFNWVMTAHKYPAFWDVP